MKALIVIDYTNDFIAESGTLSIGEPGRAIEETVTQTTKMFTEAGDFVVLAVDVHEEDDSYHPETALFPPHNLRGSTGRNLYGTLGTYYETVKHLPNVYFLNKTRYSAFVGTDLDIKLRERGVTEVHLIGDVTDICVLHTAVYAYSLNYSIVVHKNAVASFDSVGHKWALNHFTNVLGASIIE
ncbi:cysteine hydrolase family protein [Aureibacillus halotolerans]|uniref:Nicotinamidase-related amidase n=1 Tax=Aureibacillus halotolerans TaxID=1508390 RepID=A0A4R6UA45_9BACI|nr:isochorismatase family cysteine hydrolase [Aureibacillus halotolerans]TDQ42712.1 nicotinamidase-related amidase [Aureibacillus halotolerans]